eukprot:CAMPEP_0177762862 /NCGR_PEP_ID=MMETSP0491_2-20121128/6567_1 /TAXON_ID=63592 /ORGANISM="Tetraselmis chuii, Strain PLY429" /LENGTH=803 /DNA_ID=CAMNT_0019278937 /DNA_START=1048 /DNA_END=3459 /DNA_ORIENTATION=+
MAMSASEQSLASFTSVSSGTGPDSDKVRLRFSYGGRIEQGVDGMYKYHGGHQYLDSVPRTWSYADLMFRLSEKVKDAVAVKYQLPGEDLDPDSLISVTDNSDLQEMFDEYVRALAQPGTPVKTFRLRVFLFRAQEDIFMPEHLLAMSRNSSERDLGNSSAAGSEHSGRRTSEHEDEVGELRNGIQLGKRISWSSFGSNVSSASQHSTVSKSSAPKPPTQPLKAMALDSPGGTDTASAWEDGFRAGQEASYFAEECMWEELLMKKLNRATKYCSFSELCDPDEDVGGSSGELRADAMAWVVKDEGHQEGQGSDGDTGMPDAKRRPMLSVPDRAPREYEASIAYAQYANGDEEDGQVGDGEKCQPPFLPNLGSDFGVVASQDEEQGEDHDRPGKSTATTGVKLPSQLGSDLGDDQSNLAPPSTTNNNGHLPAQRLTAASGIVRARPPPHRGPSYLLPGAGPGVTYLGAHGHRHVDHPVDELLEQSMQYGSLTPPSGMHSPTSPALHRQWSGSSSKSQHSVHYVPQEEVKQLCKIGEGAFGEVSLATAPIFGKVAVKWLKATKLGGRHSPAFWQEAELLSSLNHPNVIRFFGVVVENVASHNVVGIITEYMSGGSMSALLHTPPGLPLPPVIPLRRRAELALGAVNGMAYLHELRIVHFDLKPDNLLLDGDLYSATNVKVADFGLSKHKYTSYVSGCKDLRGTLPYMAPELVSDPDHVSEKADVWSMGIVLWELVARQVPYVELSPQQIVSGLMSGCLRPDTPDWVEDEWRLLVESCLVVNPQHRPSFRELAARLERVRDEAAFLA